MSGEAPPPRAAAVNAGHRIAVTVAGDDGAPTVLAVHGFASDARAMWEQTGWLQTLQDAGLRVVAPDLRSHGESGTSAAASDHTLAALVDDLAAVVSLHCPDVFHYLGYSLGARLGWEYSLRSTPAPRTLGLGGFSLADPFAGVDVDAIRQARAGDPPLDERESALVAMMTALPGNDVDALCAVIEGVRGSDVAAGVPAVPTLVVNGSEDSLAPDGAALAGRLAQGTYVEVAGRTHRNAVTARAFKSAVIAHIRAHDIAALAFTSR